MSLINEALKKAQKMRHEPAAAPHAQHGPEHAASAHTHGHAPAHGHKDGFSGKSVALIAGGAGLLACVCILATVALLRKPSAPTQEARPATTTASSQAQPAASPLAAAPAAPAVPVIAATPTAAAPVASTPTPAPVQTAAKATAPASAETGPVISLPAAMSGRTTETAPAPASVAQNPVVQTTATPSLTPVAAPTSAPATTPAPAAATRNEQPIIQLPGAVASASSNAAIAGNAAAAPVQAQPNAPIPTPEQLMQKFVQNARIGGIRPGIKVLINNRAYKPGDLVDATLGLRLTEIGSDHLLFTDAKGNRLSRNF